MGGTTRPWTTMSQSLGTSSVLNAQRLSLSITTGQTSQRSRSLSRQCPDKIYGVRGVQRKSVTFLLILNNHHPQLSSFVIISVMTPRLLYYFRFSLFPSSCPNYLELELLPGLNPFISDAFDSFRRHLKHIFSPGSFQHPPSGKFQRLRFTRFLCLMALYKCFTYLLTCTMHVCD